MFALQEFKSILVTGGAGTCGSRIVEELLESNSVERVISLDNDEGSLFSQSQRLNGDERFFASLTDIRDKSSLLKSFIGVDLVVHCAAYKNVPVCEENPTACIDVNIKGSQNVIDCAIEHSVKKVIFTSSDKAVNPTNLMGASKLVGERLFVASNLLRTDTIFAATRFGNVLGSTGSVLPIFVNQVLNGQPMTLTNPAMTRFMMSQKSAAELVLETAEQARGGEVFITKMPVINMGVFSQAVYDFCLAEGLCNGQFDPVKNLTIIGARSAEKDYEELMSAEELSRSVECGDFFVVLPAKPERPKDWASLLEQYHSYNKPCRTYNSHDEAALDMQATLNFVEQVLRDDGLTLGKLSA